MPGESTYYTRLKVLLELSDKWNTNSKESLLGRIYSDTPPNFVYRRWSEKEEKEIRKCSQTAVLTTLDIANDLGLLEKHTGGLTRQGKSAVNEENYDRIVSKQIGKYLKSIGCPKEEMEDTAKKLIRNRNIILPTTEELYKRLCVPNNAEISLKRFRTILGIWAVCGGIGICRKHLFLPK